ncbi:MAG TPA: PKD-like domain-containing protein [Cyclobacteriaceae bacterium]
MSAGAGKLANELIDDAWTNQTGGQVSVIYTVTPLSSAGCSGQPFDLTVNVDPEPATTAPVVTAGVCSDVATGYVLSVVGASSYVVSVNSNGLTQSAGSGTPSVISDDAWTNATAAAVNVVYTVTPVSAAGCNGDVFTVTVPITPEPRGVNDTRTICSNTGALGYNLQVNNITALGNGLASTFMWQAANQPNVSNETTALQSTSVINDNLINVTSSDQVVVYTVTPTSGSCVGDNFTVSVTVRPEPVGVPVTATRCSDVVLGTAFTLNTNGTSVSAASYTIATNPNGLTQSAGTVSAGVGKLANELIDDAWTNQTAGQVSVIYTVTPLSSAGCSGQPFVVTVNIDPEPVTTAPVVTAAVCSDVATGYVLGVAGASTYNISVNSNGLLQSAGTISSGAGKPANEIADDQWTNVTLANINVIYTVIPVTGLGCVGDAFTVTIPIKPEPSGVNHVKTICSNTVVGYDLQVTNINGLGNAMPSSFVWIAADNPSVSNESLTNQTTSTINNNLINVSPFDQVVVYTVTPTGTASGCVGNNFTISVTVKPEPVGIADAKTVCSDVAIDYNLLLNVATMGNNVGSTFSWVAADNVNPLVTGESLTPQAGPIIDDVITNLTSSDQLVLYTVTPTGTDACVGQPFVITVTIKPEPVGVTATAAAICSGTSVSYDLQNNVNTLGNNLLSNFTWTATPNANITGETTSLKSAAIIDDVLVNVTTSDQIVIYTVTPTGQTGGCIGNPFTISVTVNPKAIFSAGPDLAVCVADASKLLTGTSSFAPGGLLWTGGSNNFSNNAIPNPAYTLSPAELAVTSPLSVTLTLRAFGTGACPDLTDQMVLTINPQPIVTFSGFPAGTPPQMAENNIPITLTGNQVGGVFTITPVTSNIGSTIPNPVDKASFDPSAVDLGSNFVTYTYTDLNGCSNLDTQEVIVNPVTNVDFTMQYTFGSAPFPFVPLNGVGVFEFCADIGLIKLIGNPVASSGLPPETQFTSIPAYGGGPTATITFDGADYFLQTNGLTSDTYRILYTYKNAFNAITTRIRDVTVFASPVADFTSTGSCFGGASIFTDGSTINPTPFPTTITNLDWNFGDLNLLSGPPGGVVPPGTHAGNTSGTYSVPNHIYLSPSSYNASLKVTTAQGCSTTIVTPTPIIVGSIPVSDFAFSSICNNDSTKFIANISNLGVSTVQSYNWDFGDGSTLSGNGTIPLGTHGGATSGTYAQPLHNYSSFGSYNVTLTVSTNFNCISPVKNRPVKIASFVTVTPTLNDPPYDFENGRQSWFIEDLTNPDDTASVSWNWGLPTGIAINTAVNGSNVWWTQKNSGTYFNNEKSAVNGPCFNLSLLNRPMVALDYWSDTENNVDGAVIQYSTNGGITWNIVGPPVGVINRDEGINWYNGVTIPSNPGNQPLGSYGWTGKTAGWKNGRFNLDMVPNAERDQVRLRIAFSSNDLNPSGGPDDNFDGFAFDNVFVGDKKRNVLVEHFTNSNSTPIQTSNTYLDNLLTDQFTIRAVSDFKDIRYYITSASSDPLNTDNPTDPGARASYYNVSQAPSTIMDGKLDGVKFKGSFLDINTIEIDRRALVDPLFELALDTIPTSNSNTITVRLTITATQAFTAPLLAQVVLVENNVGSENNVVRKQLFGADGLTISTPWTLGQTLIQTKSDVAINVPVVNSNQLTLVGYIQNKNTKEIYQSVVISGPAKTGTVVVGLEDEPMDQLVSQITLYPNPANGQVNFALPVGNLEGYYWQIADQRGVIMIKGDFMQQIDYIQPVDISSLPNGVYHIIITGKGRSATYKKLVVMNRN